VTPNSYFHLVSLGCPKNRVDSERIISVMERSGFEHVQDPAYASTIIINTCAFVQQAVEESIDVILDYAQHDQALIVVAGCLPLRYKKELEESLREVALFVEPDHIYDLPKLLHKSRQDYFLDEKVQSVRSNNLPQAGSRTLTTPGYAYLKIAEGCRRKCSYCTIPSIRGPLRSTDLKELVQEAKNLASMSVRELVLVAQDLTAYGFENGDKDGLPKLLKCIRMVDGIEWIRLMYLHPEGLPEDLAEIINESDNILPYLDIPFQHVADTVLKAMRRPSRGDYIRRLVDRLRIQIPNLVIRTTFMVGFPTEDNKAFAELRDFVERYRIERIGVFIYSPEEGTPAYKLGDPIPHQIKAERADEILSIGSKILKDINRERIGSTENCLVEGFSDETELLLQGRVWDQAPEVDGVTYITAGHADLGDMQRVQITDSYGPDLFGELTT
jgi:ribosomal protein S12 methylthiotransferase